MESIKEILKQASPQQIKKISSCKSTDEIRSTAKVEGIDITDGHAEEILKMITPPDGELCDEALEKVSGGYYAL